MENLGSRRALSVLFNFSFDAFIRPNCCDCVVFVVFLFAENLLPRAVTANIYTVQLFNHVKRIIITSFFVFNFSLLMDRIVKVKWIAHAHTSYSHVCVVLGE